MRHVRTSASHESGRIRTSATRLCTAAAFSVAKRKTAGGGLVGSFTRAGPARAPGRRPGTVHQPLERGILEAPVVGAAEPRPRPGLGDTGRRRRVGVPHGDEGVELAGAGPFTEHAEVDLVELEVDPHGAKLLLQESRVLATDRAGRGDEQPERERMPITIADAVAVRVGPAQPRERAGGAGAVVRQLAGLGIG